MSQTVIINRYTDIYETVKTQEGDYEEVKVKSDIKLKTSFLKDDVEAILEVCNAKGTKYKTRCLIKTRSIGEIVIDLSFKDAHELFFNGSKIKGYDSGNTSIKSSKRINKKGTGRDS